MDLNFMDAVPQSEAMQGIEVWYCRKGTRSLLRLLEPPRWLPIHWLNGRSRPCEGKSCPPNWHARPIDWKGYLAAMLHCRNLETDQKEWRRVVLEIPKSLERHLIGREFGNLLVWLNRPQKSTDPITLEFQDATLEQLMQLPPAPLWDIRPILMRMMNLRPGPAPADEPPQALRIFGEKAG